MTCLLAGISTVWRAQIGARRGPESWPEVAGAAPDGTPTRSCAARPRDGFSRNHSMRSTLRQSEFCGEDTTGGVDMRKLRFRPRPSGPGGGVPSRTVSPIPFPINAMGSVVKAGGYAGRPKAISRTGQGFPGRRGRARDAVARI